MASRNAKEVALKLNDGTLLEGKVVIGEFRRLSDFFVRGGDPFFVVYDATLAGREGDVFIVNKNEVVWAQPLDTGGSSTGLDVPHILHRGIMR
jgi:hypothetical protein